MSVEGELTQITVRIPRDLHAKYWQAKILARVKTVELVQRPLEAELYKLDL